MRAGNLQYRVVHQGDPIGQSAGDDDEFFPVMFFQDFLHPFGHGCFFTQFYIAPGYYFVLNPLPKLLLQILHNRMHPLVDDEVEGGIVLDETISIRRLLISSASSRDKCGFDLSKSLPTFNQSQSLTLYIIMNTSRFFNNVISCFRNSHLTDRSGFNGWQRRGDRKFIFFLATDE